MAGQGDTIEMTSGTNAFFTFGRFNPPTIGHKLLVDKVIAFSNGEGNQGEEGEEGDAYAFVTSTQDRGSNPLSVNEKVGILKLMYPNDEQVRIINTTERSCRTIPQVIGKLREAGYERLVMIVGSDRVEAFKGKFDGVTVVSAGQRDMDTEEIEGVSSISASKMRKLARNAALLGNTANARATKAALMRQFRNGINEKVSNASVDDMIQKIQERWNIPKPKGETKRARNTGSGSARKARNTSSNRRKVNGTKE